MSDSLHVLVKSAENLRDADLPGSDKANPYVKLWVQDSSGQTLAGPKETPAIVDDHNPMWNEELVFEGLEAPLAHTLHIEVFDQGSLTGVGEGTADATNTDDRLGSADVNLGKLQKTPEWQDFDLVIEQSILGIRKAVLSIALSTPGSWGHC